MKKTLMTIALIILSAAAQAYDGWSSGAILKIRIQSDRILITQENAANPGKCSNTDYINLPQGDSIHLKNMFAALLTAYATGKKVDLALSGCANGYPAISEVWIR